MYPNSRLKIISVDGAAGASADLPLRPESGRNYRVIEAWGWHNDDVGGGVDVYWGYQQYNGAAMGKTIDGTAKTAINIRVPITQLKADIDSTIIGELILRHNVYAKFGVLSVALAAGKQLKMRAFVEEFDGPDD